MSDSPPPADASPAGPRLELQTPRLRLTAGSVALAPAVRDFSWRNHSHFKPWNPPAPEGSYTLEAQAARLQAGLEAFAAGTGWRWWLLPAGELAASPMGPSPVIGSLHFSQVMRGAFHSAVLGYSLDEAYVGRGLMTEALRAGLAEVFSERVNLHRVQAAYRPENTRSAAVLERLGFAVEGLAPRYLFIDGDWRDHRVASLLNPGFPQARGLVSDAMAHDPFQPPCSDLSEPPPPGSPLKAITIGLAVDIGGTFISSFLIGLLAGVVLLVQGVKPDQLQEASGGMGPTSPLGLTMIAVGYGFSYLGGYICMRIARQPEIGPGLALAALSTLAGLLLGGDADEPARTTILSALDFLVVLAGSWHGRSREPAAVPPSA